MIREKVFAANWKMNGDLKLVQSINKYDFSSNNDNTSNTIVIIPPSPYILSFTNSIAQIGIQNFSPHTNGPYTGEIGLLILEDLKPTLKWALIGHSERRKLYNEDDIILEEKLRSILTLTTGISTIICCGEEEGQDRKEVLARQILSYFSNITPNPLRTVIAYEPVWAIGTGKVATPSIVKEAHQYIRCLVEENWGSDIANSIRIIYGGSVNVTNSSSLIEIDGVDGFLIGGASLILDDFISIIGV